ncbi:MAG: hypothetical protein WDN25_20505 [Acetobacteraceae bacterium]
MIDQYSKYLLDLLDKNLEDSRALGRLGLGTIVTFGLAVLAANANRKQLIADDSPPRLKHAFTAILLLAFATYALNLHANWREVHNIVCALSDRIGGTECSFRLAHASAVAEPKQLLSADLHQLLLQKYQYQHADLLLAFRLIIVGIPLFILWLFVLDYDGPLMRSMGRRGRRLRRYGARAVPWRRDR